MASLSASIVSTLVLLLIMEVKMGHTQTVNCGNIKPRGGLWSDIAGKCFIQKTVSAISPLPIKCAFTTIEVLPLSTGQSTLTVTPKSNGVPQDVKFTWTQVTNALVCEANTCSPPQQVVSVALPPSNQTTVNTVVFMNENGDYIMTSCALGSTTLLKAIICTIEQIVDDADLQPLVDKATTLGITSLVTVDQTDC